VGSCAAALFDGFRPPCVTSGTRAHRPAGFHFRQGAAGRRPDARKAHRPFALRLQRRRARLLRGARICPIIRNPSSSPWLVEAPIVELCTDPGGPPSCLAPTERAHGRNLSTHSGAPRPCASRFSLKARPPNNFAPLAFPRSLGNAVLVATNELLEGVDVPGSPALGHPRTRSPFVGGPRIRWWPPTMMPSRAQGGNPLRNIPFLPPGILLKQGFWPLLAHPKRRRRPSPCSIGAQATRALARMAARQPFPPAAAPGHHGRCTRILAGAEI